MIEPTIGCVVWFRPGKDAAAMRIQCDGKQPLAAIVVYVHGERRVNLDVIDAMGRHHGLLDVPLLQDDDKAPANDAPYAEWMPFQKGQAQKTEAVEKVLESVVPNVRPPYQMRVREEKAELDARLAQLTTFFGTPIFCGLVDEERERLAAQERAMSAYSQILADRIAAFE